MTGAGYNGWANYETWAVKLWIDNEEPSYDHWNEAADAAWNATDEDDPPAERSQAARIALADQLKAEHEDATPTVVGVYADLLNAALGAVDWFEIADAMLRDLAENDPDAMPYVGRCAS